MKQWFTVICGFLLIALPAAAQPQNGQDKKTDAQIVSTAEIVKIDVARADEWIRKGAHASETVRDLIVRARQATA